MHGQDHLVSILMVQRCAQVGLMLSCDVDRCMPCTYQFDQCNALNHPWGNFGMGTERRAFHRFLFHRFPFHRFPFHRLNRFPTWLCYTDLIEKATSGWHCKKGNNDGTNKSTENQPWYIRRKAAASLLHVGVYISCKRCQAWPLDAVATASLQESRTLPFLFTSQRINADCGLVGGSG